MDVAPSNLSPPVEAETAAAAERTGRHLRMLAELAELGMGLAREVAQAAAEASQPSAKAEAALAFSRIAKSVRQTIALEARVAEGPLTPAPPVRRESPAAQTPRRKRIRELMKEAVTASDRGDKENLLADMEERLDDPAFAAAFADRPIGEVVATICEEFELDYDCRKWTNEEMGLPPVTEKPSAGPEGAAPA